MNRVKYDWVVYGQSDSEVAFSPSAADEAVVKRPTRTRGRLTGVKVTCIIKPPHAEGGGADVPHPVWTFLMEGVR